MRATFAFLLAPLAAAALMLGGCGSGSTSTPSGAPGGSSGGDGGSSDNTGGFTSFPPTGNQYVDARRCPACHQSQNPQQTGFMAGTDVPLPGSFGPGVALYGPNLTPDPTTGIGNWNDDQIATAIQNGVDNQGERLCPQMQHFADMQATELQSIIGWLHSLAPVVHQVHASSCPPLKP